MKTFRLACISILLALHLPAAAQVRIRSDWVLDQRIPTAVPDFVAAPGNEALAREMAGVVAYDLLFTGLFEILPPADYPPAFKGFSAGAVDIDFAAWRQTRAECLVYAYVSVEGDRVVAECRLFDVLASRQVLGKVFRSERRWARLVAHQFSDEIVGHLTGVPGVATSQICFSAGESGRKEIYIADYDGANAVQVTRHESISILPKFSPDGRRIAYLSYKDRYPYLYVLDVSTGQSRPLSKHVGLNIAPAWSPRSEYLAVVLSKDGNPEIYLVGADGNGLKRLTDNEEIDSSPTFDPTGRTLAFVSERQGSPQIFAMDANGSNVRRLSHQGGRSTDPAWSLDGKSIAYVVETGEGTEIYVMDRDGNNPRRLTNSPGSNEAPSWSADSRHVIFVSTRSGRSELWTVNVDSGDQRPVPLLNMRAQGPFWGPRRQ